MSEARMPIGPNTIINHSGDTNSDRTPMTPDTREALKDGVFSTQADGQGNMTVNDLSGGTVQTDGGTGSLPGVLSTVRSKSGSVINDMGQIRPDSTITVTMPSGKTLTTNVGTALSMGIIQRGADGNYYDPNQEQFEAQKAQSQQKAKEVNEKAGSGPLMDTHHTSQFNEMCRRGGSATVAAWTQKAFTSALSGEKMGNSVDTYARAIGVEPNSMVEFTNSMMNNVLNRAVDLAEERFGIDSEEMLTFALEKMDRRRLASILTAAAFGDRKHGINQLYNAWKLGNKTT